MAIVTVQDYVTQARILTQDQVQPYRYPDTDFLAALNSAVGESRRLRPDLWLNATTLPSFTAVDTTTVGVDQQYAMAFVYYLCGQAQMRDEEETEDNRSAMFMAMFEKRLTGAVNGNR